MKYFEGGKYALGYHCHKTLSPDQVVGILRYLGNNNFTPQDIVDYLGQPKYDYSKARDLLIQLKLQRVIDFNGFSIDAIVRILHAESYARDRGKRKHTASTSKRKPNPNI